MAGPQPDPYVADALAEIEAWRNPPQTIARRLAAVAGKPFEFAGAAVMRTPGVGWVIEKTVSGLVDLLNDGMSRTVRVEAILREYRDDGHPQVDSLEAIGGLHLRDVDRTIGYLGAKYKAAAAVEGGAAGAAGLPGIPPDLVALMGLNLRAIGEYATYCGFDIRLQQERLFALHVLGFASSSTEAGKRAALMQLAKIAADIAKRRTWRQLEQHAFVAMIRKIAEAIGVRLTKAKLAQVVPVAGAAVGAGFNAYYTARVCEAAYFLYRERFILGQGGFEPPPGDLFWHRTE